MPKFTDNASVSPWSLNTRRIVVAGVLSAITIILSLIPNIGFITVPNVTKNATIEHIPTILGGVIGGPIVGFVCGLIFGLVSFFHATDPIFKDPLVAILPRLFIGLTAWAVFASLVRINRTLAAAVAGIIGSLTNTVLVVGAIIVRGYVPAPAIVPFVIPQAIFESITAAILAIILAHAFHVLETRQVRAPDTKSRDQLPY